MLTRNVITHAALLIGTGLLPACDNGLDGPSPEHNAITAKQRLDDEKALSKSHRETLELWTVVGDDVTTGGTSAAWRYLFADISQAGAGYWFHATAFEATVDSSTPMPEGAARVTHSWFDSDSASHCGVRPPAESFSQASTIRNVAV